MMATDGLPGVRARPTWVGSVVWPKLIRGSLSGGQLATRVVFTLMGLGIAVGIYLGSAWFLTLCYQVETVGPLICRRLLDIVLLVLLSVLLLSNIVTALSSFFLARDLELLVTAPIPPRSLFGARFAEQVIHSSWMVLAFGLPTMLAFAKVAGGGTTYLAIFAVLPPLLVFPAAAGMILALSLVSFLPAARVRDIVVALLFITFLVLYLLLRVAEPERFLNPEGFTSMVHFMTSLSSASSPLIPSHWATAVLVATFRDSTSSGGWPLMLVVLWTGCGTSYVLSSALFRLIYTRGFSRAQESSRVARLSRLVAWIRRQPAPVDGRIPSPGRRAPGVDLIRLMAKLAPRGATREFFIKDLKLLFRDASQWSQLVLLLALVFVYLYNFKHFKDLGDTGFIGRLAIFLVGLGLSGFVTTAVSVRFAFPLVSLEGRMLWLLRTAPMRPRQVLWSKLFATLPPLFVVAQVMSIASSTILGAAWPMVALGSVVAGLTAVSVASLSIGLGAVLPDFEAESAAKVAASFGGLVCMSVAMVMALLLVALAIYPAYALHFSVRISTFKLVLCGAGGLAVTLVSCAVPLWLGARSLERDR